MPVRTFMIITIGVLISTLFSGCGQLLLLDNTKDSSYPTSTAANAQSIQQAPALTILDQQAITRLAAGTKVFAANMAQGIPTEPALTLLDGNQLYPIDLAREMAFIPSSGKLSATVFINNQSANMTMLFITDAGPGTTTLASAPASGRVEISKAIPVAGQLLTMSQVLLYTQTGSGSSQTRNLLSSNVKGQLYFSANEQLTFEYGAVELHAPVNQNFLGTGFSGSFSFTLNYRLRGIRYTAYLEGTQLHGLSGTVVVANLSADIYRVGDGADPVHIGKLSLEDSVLQVIDNSQNIYLF